MSLVQGIVLKVTSVPLMVPVVLVEVIAAKYLIEFWEVHLPLIVYEKQEKSIIV